MPRNQRYSDSKEPTDVFRDTGQRVANNLEHRVAVAQKRNSLDYSLHLVEDFPASSALGGDWLALDHDTHPLLRCFYTQDHIVTTCSESSNRADFYSQSPTSLWYLQQQPTHPARGQNKVGRSLGDHPSSPVGRGCPVSSVTGLIPPADGESP